MCALLFGSSGTAFGRAGAGRPAPTVMAPKVVKRPSSKQNSCERRRAVSRPRSAAPGARSAASMVGRRFWFTPEGLGCNSTPRRFCVKPGAKDEAIKMLKSLVAVHGVEWFHHAKVSIRGFHKEGRIRHGAQSAVPDAPFPAFENPRLNVPETGNAVSDALLPRQVKTHASAVKPNKAHTPLTTECGNIMYPRPASSSSTHSASGALGEVSRSEANDSSTTNDLRPTKVLGRGTFGVVYSCRRWDTGVESYVGPALPGLHSADSVAVKVIHVTCAPASGDEDGEREIGVLKNLKWSSHIIDLLACWKFPFHYRLMFPEYDGTLSNIVKARPLVSDSTLATLLSHMVSALVSCRDSCVLHRDIKPANIFICLLYTSDAADE